jgi:hypothetical protein
MTNGLVSDKHLQYHQNVSLWRWVNPIQTQTSDDELNDVASNNINKTAASGTHT